MTPPRPEDRPAGRLVLLDKDQRVMLEAIAKTVQPIIAQHLIAICDAFDAAPADPAETIAGALMYDIDPEDYQEAWTGAVVDAQAVLVALGADTPTSSVGEPEDDVHINDPQRGGSLPEDKF